MISKRIQFLTDADLRGELLEVIKAWDEQVPHASYSGTYEEDRIALAFDLFDYLTGKRK